MKKIISLFIILVLLMSFVPTSVLAAISEADVKKEPTWEEVLAEHGGEIVEDFTPPVRLMSASSDTFRTSQYVVLAIDVSGSMSGTPLSVAKSAAKKFCETMVNLDTKTYVAIVDFETTSSLICDFTDNLTTLNSKINSLSLGGGTNLTSALTRADNLLKSVSGEGVIKSLVVLSDGVPNSPSDARNTANAMKGKTCIYSLGFFHDLSGSSLTTARTLMKDIQNCGYVDVTSVNDLEPLLKDIANTNWGSEGSNLTSNSPVYSTETGKILDELKLNASELLSNVSCGNHPIKGPSVTFLGKTFYFFEIDGSVELEFGKVSLQLRVDTEEKIIEGLLGFENFSADADVGSEYNDTKDTRWRKSYDQVKSLYKSVTGKNVTTNKLWNQFSSIRGQLKELDSSLLIDAKCKIAGFLEWSYETGSAQLHAGGMLMEASIGGELVGKAPTVLPLYVVVGLKASLGGKILVAYEQCISVNSELNTAIAANIGVGLGSKKAKTFIEGGAVAELGANIIVASGSFKGSLPDYDPLTLTLKGDFYLKGSLLGWLTAEKKWPIGSPVQLYPSNNASLMAFEMFDETTIDEVIANSVPLPRDYLNDTGLMEIDDSDKLYSDKNVYPYNDAVLTILSDGRLMLIWIDDLGAKLPINRTSLMYSIYDGEEWSNAEELFETGTYNGAPVIYNDGENVHIVWNKAQTVFANTAGLEDLITDTEINYTCFSGDKFTSPVKITDNNLIEANYIIVENEGNIAVAWTENSENDPYMTSGTNSLYLRECINGIWGTKKLLKQSENTIDEIELYYVNNAVNCAYTIIENGIAQLYNNSVMLAQGNYIEYYDSKIYYLAGDTLAAYDVTKGTISETSIKGITNFSIYDGNIYTLVNNGFKCELYESKNTNGIFAPFKQVTEFGRYIRDYSVVATSAGAPVYALNLVEVNDSDDVFGDAELAVCTASDVSALRVNAAYYDVEKGVPSGTLPITIEVANTGTTDITSLYIAVANADGKVVTSNTVSASIPAGESGEITYNYSLPATLKETDITITVTDSDKEKNLDDNSNIVYIDCADVEVTDAAVDLVDGTAVLTGKVKNTGYVDAENLVLSIYDSSIPDKVIGEIDCGTLGVGETYSYTYVLPDKYLTLKDKLTMYGITTEATCDNRETDYANNDAKAVFGELTEYLIAFVDGTEIFDIVGASELATYELYREGYEYELYYSPIFSEESKFTEIPDNIGSNITVYVKWIKQDSIIKKLGAETVWSAPAGSFYDTAVEEAWNGWTAVVESGFANVITYPQGNTLQFYTRTDYENISSVKSPGYGNEAEQWIIEWNQKTGYTTTPTALNFDFLFKDISGNDIALLKFDKNHTKIEGDYKMGYPLSGIKCSILAYNNADGKTHTAEYYVDGIFVTKETDLKGTINGFGSIECSGGLDSDDYHHIGFSNLAIGCVFPDTYEKVTVDYTHNGNVVYSVKTGYDTAVSSGVKVDKYYYIPNGSNNAYYAVAETVSASKSVALRKLANSNGVLAVGDVFEWADVEQTVSGKNLLPNSDFGKGTNGWFDSSGKKLPTWVATDGIITYNAQGSPNLASLYKAVKTEIGKAYVLVYDTNVASNSNVVSMKNDISTVDDGVVIDYIAVAGRNYVAFTAESEYVQIKFTNVADGTSFGNFGLYEIELGELVETEDTALMTIGKNPPNISAVVEGMTDRNLKTWVTVSDWNITQVKQGENVFYGNIAGSDVKPKLVVTSFPETFTFEDATSPQTITFSENITGKFYVEYDFVASNLDNCWMYFSADGALWGVGQVGLGFDANNEGGFRAQPNSSTTLAVFEANKEYRFFLTCDVNSDTYNLVVTDNSTGEQIVKVNGNAFRTASSYINSLVMTSNGEPGVFEVKNLRLYSDVIEAMKKEYTVITTVDSIVESSMKQIAISPKYIMAEEREGYHLEKIVDGLTITFEYVKTTKLGVKFKNTDGFVVEEYYDENSIPKTYTVEEHEVFAINGATGKGGYYIIPETVVNCEDMEVTVYETPNKCAAIEDAYVNSSGIIAGLKTIDSNSIFVAAGNDSNRAPLTDEDGASLNDEGTSPSLLGSSRVGFFNFPVVEPGEGQVALAKFYVRSWHTQTFSNGNTSVRLVATAIDDDSWMKLSNGGSYVALNAPVFESYTKTMYSSVAKSNTDYIYFDVTDVMIKAAEKGLDTITLKINTAWGAAYIAEREAAVAGGAYEGHAAYVELVDANSVAVAGATKVTKMGTAVENTLDIRVIDGTELKLYSDIGYGFNDGETGYALTDGVVSVTADNDVTYKLMFDTLSGSCGTNASWKLESNGVLTISGTGDMANYTNSSKKPWDMYDGLIDKIVVEEGITRIGNYAFNGIESVKSIILPESATTVAVYAFKDCTRLKEIVLPEYVNTIGTGAFYNCTSLECISIPDKVVSIGTHLFQGCTSLKSAVIGSGITTLSTKMFNECTSLETVDFTNAVTTIEDGAFNNCNIKTVKFRGTAEEWPSVTVADNNVALTNAEFEFLGRVASGVVLDVTELVLGIGLKGTLNATVLPEDATNKNVVWSSDNEEVVTVENGVVTGMALGTANVTVIPEGGGESATCVVTVTADTIASGSINTDTYWTLEADGTLIIGGTDAMTNYTSSSKKPWDKYAEQIVRLEVKDGITRVGNYAFNGLPNLKIAVIADSVTVVSVYAFSSCGSLEKVKLSDNLKTLGSAAFYKCESLKKITIPDSVTSLGTLVFQGCTALQSAVIGSGITSVPTKTFNLCTALKKVELSKSIIGIAEYAFNNCSNLATVYFDGSAEEWSDISVEEYNADFADAEVIYGKDPTIDMIISAGEATGECDDIVVIPVVVTDNEGMAAFKFTFDYDTDVFEVMNVTQGRIMRNGLFVDNVAQGGALTVTWSDAYCLYDDGTLFTIELKVAESAATGVYPIALEFVEGDITDDDLNDVKFNLETGTITVREPIVIIGDVYEDGAVNTKDSVRLNQYLAEWDMELSEYELKAADIYPDNSITIKDSVKLGRYLAGREAELFDLKDEPGKIVFETGEATYDGNYIDVPVIITENTGVAGFKLNVGYDDFCIIPVEVVSTWGEGDVVSTIDEMITITWSSIDEICATGEAFMVRFEAIGDIADEIAIELYCEEGNVCDENCRDLEVEFVNGVIGLIGENIYEYTVVSLDGDVEAGRFYAEVELENNGDDEDSAVIILAVYKDEEIVDMAYMTGCFETGQIIRFRSRLEGINGGILKAFVVNNLDDMNIISNILEK